MIRRLKNVMANEGLKDFGLSSLKNQKSVTDFIVAFHYCRNLEYKEGKLF